MKSWVNTSKAKVTDLFKSKKDFFETIIKFLANPAHSLATTLAIMTMMAIDRATDSGETSTVVILGLLMVTTWFEFFTVWKKKLDK